MRLPNKLFSYSESTLAVFPILLKRLYERPYGLLELYYATQYSHRSLADFIDTLSALYLLRKIDLDDEGRVYYVD